MSSKTVAFASTLLAALLLGPALAHLLELPNKIELPADAYLTVQQIYRGWARLGVLVFAALIATGWLAILTRHDRRVRPLVLGALAALVLTQVVFWTFTYPANTATENWTMLPDNWAELRVRWEWSHATSAVLNILATALLIGASMRLAAAPASTLRA